MARVPFWAVEHRINLSVGLCIRQVVIEDDFTRLVSVHPMQERCSVTWIKPNVACSGSWVASTLGQAEQIMSMHYDCAWNIVFDQVVSDDALECSTGVVSWCHNPYIKLSIRP